MKVEKVGLIDVDGHNFPNLALMKISAWHKAKNDEVEWFFPMKKYDKVYMSKVFTFTPDYNTCINANEIIQGGTGYGLDNKLPYEVEHIYPDYELYKIKDTAYGYLTRGCPRGCPFCIVGKKEGFNSYKVADLNEFWKGQKEIKLLDPNLLASNERIELLEQLVQSKAKIDFTQGLDIRFMDKDTINLFKKLNQQKQIKMIHFAWDRMNQNDLIIRNLTEFKNNVDINFRKLRVYVLVNYETSMEENLYRIYKLKELGYDPYIMIYEKEKLKKGHELKKLQRWVNSKWVFRSCDRFEDYKVS